MSDDAPTDALRTAHDLCVLLAHQATARDDSRTHERLLGFAELLDQMSGFSPRERRESLIRILLGLRSLPDYLEGDPATTLRRVLEPVRDRWMMEETG